MPTFFQAARPASFHRFAAASAAPAALLDRDDFLAAGSQLQAALREQQRGLTLVLVEVEELCRIEENCNAAAARATRRKLDQRLRALAGERGVAARTGLYEFALLLPVDAELAWGMVTAGLDDPVVAGMQPTWLLRFIGPCGPGLEACYAQLRGRLAELQWSMNEGLVHVAA